MNIVDQEKLKEIIANPQTENERLLIARLTREKEYEAMCYHIFDGLDGLSGWKDNLAALQKAVSKYKETTREDWNDWDEENDPDNKRLEELACLWDYFEGVNPDWEAMFADISNAFDACDEIFKAMPDES